MITMEKLEELHNRMKPTPTTREASIYVTAAELVELIEASHACLRMQKAWREINVFANS